MCFLTQLRFLNPNQVVCDFKQVQSLWYPKYSKEEVNMEVNSELKGNGNNKRNKIKV